MTTTCPARPGSARATSSNDTWQNYLGVIGRQSGVGVERLATHPANPNATPTHRRLLPVAPKAGGLFAGMAPFAHQHGRRRTIRTRRPTARRSRRPRIAAAPAQLGPDATSRCAPSAIQADYATPVTYTTTGGAIISTRDAVTFGFGLEQAERGSAQRARQARHELPAPDHGRHHAADDRRLQVPDRASRPRPPHDPVEIELTAYDERGDMDYVDLKGPDGALVQRTEVYPFQFRYTPPASAVGRP